MSLSETRRKAVSPAGGCWAGSAAGSRGAPSQTTSSQAAGFLRRDFIVLLGGLLAAARSCRFRRPARNQGDPGAQHHHEAPDPDPVDQRIDVDLDDGLARLLGLPGVNKIDVFVQPRPDGDFGGGLLAGLVEPPL